MANEWFVQHNGKQYGPLTSVNLKKLAADGKITPTTTVRLGAEGTWVPAARVQGLFPSAAPNPAAPAQAAAPRAPVAAKPKPQIAPPPTPRVTPVGRFPVAAAAPLPKAVPAPSGSMPAKILGAIALILGTVAIATCWLPVMGGAIAWTGIVVGTLGLLLGIVALLFAAAHKGSGLVFSTAGAGSSAVGLVLTVVLGVAFDMFTSPPVPMVVAKPTLPPPEPVKHTVPVPKEPEPEPEPVWTDAGQAIQQGDIKVGIVSAQIESVKLEANDLSMKRQKPQPMLRIRLAAENTGRDKIIEFPGWTGGSDLVGAELGGLLGGELGKAAQSASATAVLADNFGNKYKQTPALLISSQIAIIKEHSLRPGNTAPTDLLFPPPLETIEYLRLELSPAGFGGDEPLRFQIPRAMIGGLPKPAAATPEGATPEPGAPSSSAPEEPAPAAAP